VKNRYGGHPNVVLANQLAGEPHRRWIGMQVEDTSATGKEAA
jgi:hypothetical protein